MAHGGKRPGAGRPKGSVSEATLEKAAARELVRTEVTREILPIVRAAIKRAKGLSYLVTRDEQTGKFIRVTASTLASTKTAIEVWEKAPDIAAMKDLLDRAIDKPKEQPLEVNLTTDWDKRVSRLRKARERVKKKLGK